MGSRYSILVVVFGLMTLSGQAIELKLVASHDPDEGREVHVGISNTAAVSIYMTMFEGDGNVSFFNAFMDASPLGSGDAAGYDVMGAEFKMTRNDGSGWFRNVGISSSRNIEHYSLIAADDDEGGGPGTNGPWKGVVDSIIIHGMEVGVYDLYFENNQTAEAVPRPPGLFDLNNVQHPYSMNRRIPGFIWFKNGWFDPNSLEGDVPFLVIVVPEPSTCLLLGIGGLLLLRRR